MMSKFKIKIDSIIESIKENNIFWTSVIASILILSYYSTGHTINSYISGMFTFVFIVFWGYLMHYISHYYNFTQCYQNSTNFILEKCHNIPLLDKIIKTILETTIDFHSITHHDSSINKTPTNVVLEIVQNFLTQGGLFVFFNNYASPTFTMFPSLTNPFQLKLNNSILKLWALFYATIHNINYRLISPIEHENHHIDPKTNYGIDLADIILNSKYNTKHSPNKKITIEDHNHSTLNIIIITVFLLWEYLE